MDVIEGQALGRETESRVDGLVHAGLVNAVIVVQVGGYALLDVGVAQRSFTVGSGRYQRLSAALLKPINLSLEVDID